MGLVVTRLDVRDFRNYESLTVEPDPQLTIFVGPNAVGKTSLLEALQLLTEAESFRKPSWSDVIRWGALSCHLRMVAEGHSRRLETELDIGESGKRVYRVNGKVRRKMTEVAGILPCIAFTPDGLRLVKDSAERRREALDSVGSQLSPSYAQLRQEYDKVLRQRNSLLKQADFEDDLFSAFTDRIVMVGSKLRAHRQRLFARVLEHMRPVYAEIADGEEIDARYLCSWEREGRMDLAGLDSQEVFFEELRSRSREERARMTTLAGPHRDEISFSVSGKDARVFASQGQQRTVALAWKLAEVMVVKDVSGQSPVLLLDDVMSELDERRRHALASYVGSVAQTFVTTTNLGYFEKALVNRAKVVTLS